MEMKQADMGIRNRTSIWLSGIMGFAVGDALGAPAEFGERWMRDMDPVKEMRSGGVFDVPEGGRTEMDNGNGSLMRMLPALTMVCRCVCLCRRWIQKRQ